MSGFLNLPYETARKSFGFEVGSHDAEPRPFLQARKPVDLIKKTYEIIEIPDELSEMYTSYRHVIRSI